MTDEPSRYDLSLEQIEGTSWGFAPPGATQLMTTVHELRRKPVGLLGAEDLRVLISQRVGLDVLVPRALSWLEREPMLEGDLYPGDLLVAVLGVPVTYWSERPGQLALVESILAAVDDPGRDLAGDIDGFRRRLRAAR